MSGQDASFFLNLAEANLARGELEAGLACAEAAVSRVSTQAQAEALARVVEHLAKRLPAGAARVETLRRALKDVASAPRAAPATAHLAREVAPPDVSGPDVVDLVRRLIVSPQVVDQLRLLVAPTSTAQALELPAIEVLKRLLEADLDVRVAADLALDLVVTATRADRGFLILPDGAWFGRRSSAETLPPASRGILAEVERTRATVLVEDAAHDPRFSQLESVSELGLRSVLAVPLVRAGDAPLQGTIYLDAPRAAGVFGPRERALAEALAHGLVPAIKNARRFEALDLEVQRSRRATSEARRRGGVPAARPRLLGESAAIEAVRQLIDRVAPSAQTVLILGESGTGKELVARAIHAGSPRAAGPFVAENVASLAPGVLEAEVFGHTRGAFTGADADRPGLFRLAHGGTLFLDEVGEISEELQRKLLRVLQEREVRPVGGSHAVPVDVRVIAATHRDPLELVRTGALREDFFYRLSVLQVVVPPLRQRREDVPLLLRHFVQRAAVLEGRPAPELSPELMARATDHTWRGNVRELEAFATRVVVEGLGDDALPAPTSARATPDGGALAVDVRLEGEVVDLREARAVFERTYLRLVLERTGGVVAAAKALGVDRTHLSELLKRLGLRAPRRDRPMT